MKNTDQSSRRNNRHAFFPRTAPLRVALCALLLAGCTTGGPQGNGDLAGRQSPASAAGEISAKTVLSIAQRLRATGNLPAAITFYRRAIVLDPNQVQPYIGLGDALLADGLPNDAADSFRSALSMASTNPDAMRGLGQTLVALDKPAEAKTILEKSINIHPSAAAYGALGVADDLMGNAAEATEAYKHGLTLQPDNLNLLNNYGLSQAISGDYDAAVATLHRAATDPRAGSRNRLNLAMALGLAGRMKDAAQVARIDLDERSVQNNLAYYTELRGLSPKARAAAILRPQAPLITHIAATHCDGAPCPKPAMPDAKASAAPTTPVASKPLAAASAPRLAAKAPAEAKAKHELAAKPAKPAPKLADAAPAQAHAKADKVATKDDAAAKPMPPTAESKAKLAAEPAKKVAHAAEHHLPDSHAAASMTAAAATKPADAKPTKPDDATLSVAADSAKPAPEAAKATEKTADAAAAKPEAIHPAAPKAEKAEMTAKQAQKPADHAMRMASAVTPVTKPADAKPTKADDATLSVAADSAKPAPEAVKATEKTADAAAAKPEAMPMAAAATATPAPAPEASPAPSMASTPAPKSDDAKPDAKLADATPTVLYPTRSSAEITPSAHPQDAAPVAMDDAQSGPSTAMAKSDAPKSPAPAMHATDQSQSEQTADAAFVAATGEPAPANADASLAPQKSPIVKAAAVVPAATVPSIHHSWVQLGTFRSEQNAQAELKQMSAKDKAMLQDLPVFVRRVDLGAVRGVYYLLRVGPVADMGQAHDVCSTLKSHDLDCLIVK